MKTIHTENAPAAIGPYAQAVKTGNLVYTSGQIGIVPASGTIERTDIEGQTEQVIQNLSTVLRAADSELGKVIKTTCFLRHLEDCAAFNAVYARLFPGKPARSCVEVSALPKSALVEIECVAEINEN